jgi:hypothetical protein
MMVVPNLGDEIESCIAAIDDTGSLPSRDRYRLYARIVSLSTHHRNAAYFHLTRIGLLCAHGAFNAKLLATALEHPTRLLLSKASMVLKNQDTMDALAESLEAYHTLVDDSQFCDDITLVQSYAGFCCFAAVRAVVYELDLEALALPEQQVDPDRWDAAFYAAVAFAGSAAWELQGGAEKRRRFWEWFLRTLVPKAMAIDFDFDCKFPG